VEPAGGDSCHAHGKRIKGASRKDKENHLPGSAQWGEGTVHVTKQRIEGGERKARRSY